MRNIKVTLTLATGMTVTINCPDPYDEMARHIEEGRIAGVRVETEPVAVFRHLALDVRV